MRSDQVLLCADLLEPCCAALTCECHAMPCCAMRICERAVLCHGDL
jgi:hypothetical protein